MSIDPTQSIQIPLDSKLLQASLLAQQGQLNAARQIQQQQEAQQQTQESLNIKNYQFRVRDLRHLLQRMRPGGITMEDLFSLNITYLTYPEQEVIRFLRRNPQVFQTLAKLDKKGDTLSLEDIKKATELTRNTVVIDPELLESMTNPAAQGQPGTLHGLRSVEMGTPFSNQHPEQEIQALLAKIQAQMPAVTNPNQAITVAQLQTFRPASGTLSERELKQLSFLQSSTMIHLLNNLARIHQGYLAPEVIRVLVSLIWNPMVYGAIGAQPMMVFFDDKTWDVEPVEHVHEAIPPVYFKNGLEGRQEQPAGFRRIELSAEELRELCEHMNLGHGISLNDLRNYMPVNDREARLLGYLNRLPIFQALASLDGHSDTLDAEDIQLALNGHTLVLKDQHIVLAIVP